MSDILRKSLWRACAGLLLVLGLTGCDELFPKLEDLDLDDVFAENKPVEHIRLDSMKFYNDYKNFRLDASIINDIGPSRLDDTTQVKVRLNESIGRVFHSSQATPRLDRVVNVQTEKIRKNGIRLLALVDQTMEQPMLDRAKIDVQKIRSVFRDSLMYVAFIQGDSVTESMPVTDYVFSRYFTSVDAQPRLLRSILRKKSEMLTGGRLWHDGRYLAMIAFSNEKTYDQNSDEPIDPDHFALEEQMAMPDGRLDSTNAHFSFSYASYSAKDENLLNSTRNVLMTYCQNNHGVYLDQFRWVTFRNQMQQAFHLNFPSYQIYFTNPDNKVYRGYDHTLTLDFYNIPGDTLICTASTNYALGSLEHPVIVNDIGLPQVLARGLFLTFLFCSIVYLVLQLIVPAIRYIIFRRRYVKTYLGPNMSVGNTIVSQSCYLCKTPFLTGDKIVTKCEHTVHKECWDENKYRCPEYGDRCKHGSHYYNSNNLFDRKNGTYLLRWILLGIVSTFLAWVCYILFNKTISTLDSYEMLHSPSTGLFIGFFLTMAIHVMTCRYQVVFRQLHFSLLRSLTAALACFFVFWLCGYFSIVISLRWADVLLDFVSWGASGIIIALCGAVYTRIKLRRSFFLLNFLLAIVTSLVWHALFFNSQLGFRVILLFCFWLFALGLILLVARSAPRSNRYFLKVQGGVKTMDIALYKWFRSNANAVVTLGRSVECSIQVTWDLNGDVAPVQAEIRFVNDTPLLYAVEDGIYSHDRMLHAGQRMWLYHGRSFTIGQTTFTYVEKDI